MLTTAPSLTLSTQSIAVCDITLNNLDSFYHGLPYRYNSIIDLLFQEPSIKESLLDQLQLRDRLFYRVFIASNSVSQLPILDCLEIDGYFGGMLSTYLLDLDRGVIEGLNEIKLSKTSMFLWQRVREQGEFSFVFPASQTKESRTSRYMGKVGFQERTYGDSRCFFNGRDRSELFRDVMRELSSAILGTSDRYTFDRQRFGAAKDRQTRIIEQWSANL